MNLTMSYITRELDAIIAKIGLVASPILILFVHISLHKTLYIFPIVLTFISCIIWLLVRKNASFKSSQYNSHSLIILLISLFFMFFTLSNLSIYFRPILYERPLIYFVIISLIFGIITLEILFSKANLVYLSLFQIILIGISITWSQLLISPSLLETDSWYHNMITLNITNLHFIPDGFGYSKLPIFHLLIATTSLITGFDYKLSSMFSIGILQIICNTMFIFLLCKFLFNRSDISLFAALLLIGANFHINMNYRLVPNSFASLFIVIILYVIFKVRKDFPLYSVFITMISSAALILTHALTSMFMAISLSVLYLLSYVKNFGYNKKANIPFSTTYLVLFIVFMFSWWSFVSGNIHSLAYLIQWGFSSDYFLVSTPNNIIVSDYSELIPFAEQFFNNSGMFLYFSFSFIGCFYMISYKYGDNLKFNVALIGLIPLFLGFFSLISQHSILESRWLYFSQVFLSIPLSLGLLLMFNCFKNSVKRSILLSIFIVIFSFFLIMSPTANTDNFVFSSHSAMRSSITASELQAVKTISSVSDSTIGTDRYYSDSQQYVFNTTSFGLELYNKNFDPLSRNFILIREQIIGKPFKLFESMFYLDYDPKCLLQDSKFSNVYDCGSVHGYVKCT